MSDSAFIGLITGFVALVVVVIILVASLRSSTETQTEKPSSLQQKPGREERPSAAAIMEWYKDGLAKIVAARLKKESSDGPGEPVFLSHYISNGIFRHWVLHVHGHKYELRRVLPEGSSETATGVSTGLFAAAKYYRHVIGVSQFDMEAYKKSVISKHSPELGCYFYSIIGWTSFSPAEIDLKCEEISSSFENYDIVSNNCHDFLEKLACKIVTTKAPDWEWFQRRPLTG